MKTINTIICSNEDCSRKGNPQKETEFYKSYSATLKKYPVCKSCIKRIVDPNNIETVIPILKDIDAPFLYELWENVTNSFEDKTRVFGNYIKKIFTLSQYKGLRYEHSVFEKKTEYKIIDEKEIIYSEEWGGSYSKEDLKYLNGYLDALKKDYKITTINHLDYAKKISKVSLQINNEQAQISMGEGNYQNLERLIKIYDSLCKSAQFAESNREKKDDSFSSFSKIFEQVEQRLYVPKYEPFIKDTYDLLIDQISTTNKSL